MTALPEYDRLEASALWRESLAVQRREVFVSFGDNSLVICGPNETALSHWSLAAVHRVNPGKSPAVFTPNVDGSETLEIDDTQMVSAIETVRGVISRRRSRPGRLRLLIFLGILLVGLGLAVFWLPGVLVRHVVSIVPPEKNLQIGTELLSYIARFSGAPCDHPRATPPLRRLEKRIFGNNGTTLVVLPGGVRRSAHLPGNLILLNRALAEDYEGPEVLAGFAIVEAARADQIDPLARLLEHGGLAPTLTLLTTGQLDSDVLKTYAEYLLTLPLDPVAETDILEQFSAAGFSSSPFAYATDISGETTLALIEADPYRSRAYEPLLGDQDWVALQSICGG